jgi:hypothetical protein
VKGDHIDGIESNNDDRYAIAILLCSLVDISEQRTCAKKSKGFHTLSGFGSFQV